MHLEKRKIHRHITSFQIIILGFLAIILLGSILLTLPFASQSGEFTPFGDALFTATSAVCVTGLIVYDTATYWSLFGQSVIIILIQIGGLGVVTMMIAFTALSGKKIGLMQRSTMQDAISAHQVGGIVRMTKFIIKTCLIIESIGAILLFPYFCRDFGILKGLWYSVFHSISAFCNAGFDLMGVNTPFSSLTGYSSNPLINFTIMALIITGGLGFLTWADIGEKKFHWKKLLMQSKVIITMTSLLIIVPAVYFFFFEFSEYPFFERLWASLFQAVTPRTAGFNTVDLTTISQTGLMVIIILMITGGSPGSTAGGMKTTTAAILFSSVISVFQKEDSAHLFSRRIPQDSVKNAVIIFLMYLTLFLSGGMVISYIENVPLISAIFETGSAIGTVGLSLGITPSLGGISRAILIGLMFFGRVGGLTLLFAASSEKSPHPSNLPQEKITVG